MQLKYREARKTVVVEYLVYLVEETESHVLVGLFLLYRAC